MKKEQILDELKHIVPPHSGMNIVDLGIIQDVILEPKHKKVEILLNPHDTFCPVRYISTEIKKELENLGFKEIHIYLKLKKHTIKLF